MCVDNHSVKLYNRYKRYKFRQENNNIGRHWYRLIRSRVSNAEQNGRVALCSSQVRNIIRWINRFCLNNNKLINYCYYYVKIVNRNTIVKERMRS